MLLFFSQIKTCCSYSFTTSALFSSSISIPAPDLRVPAVPEYGVPRDRICKRFANELWGKNNGQKYDSCGMMHWVTFEDVGDENAWADKDGTAKQQGNVNGVLPWGDVDGRSGECYLLLRD